MTLELMHHLALLYGAQGQLEKAESLFTQSQSKMKRILGEDHPMTLGSMSKLAALYKAQGHHEKARVLMTELLSIVKRTRGEEDPLGRNMVRKIQRRLESLPSPEAP